MIGTRKVQLTKYWALPAIARNYITTTSFYKIHNMDTPQILLTPVPVNDFTELIKATINHAFETKQRKEFEEKLLSATETCKIFTPHISKSTLHQWTDQGLIPVYRIGGRIFYKYSEVLESAQRIKKFDRNKFITEWSKK